MHKFNNFRARGLSLGLDICSTEIRLLALRQKKRHISIEKMTVMALPLGAVIEGKIHEPDVVSAYLKAIVQKAQVYKDRVAIALPIQSVISKKIPLIEATSMSHVNDYFPGVSDTLAYDYIEIGKEMLLIATRHDELMRYVGMVQGAGLNVSVVDVDLYALARAVHFVLLDKIQIHAFLILELNCLGSQLMLLNQHDILYQQVLHGSMDQIGAQLKSVLKVYFSNENKIETKKMYLTGDMSNAIDLVEYIRVELLMETEWINPFDSMLPCDDVKDMPYHNFLVCCGLALRGLTSC